MRKAFATILLFCMTFGLQVWAVEGAEEPSSPGEMPAEVQASFQEQAPQQGQIPPQGQMYQREMSQGKMPWEQATEQRGETEEPVTGQKEATENGGRKAAAQRGGAELGGMPWMVGNTEITSEPIGMMEFLKTYSTSVVAVVLLIGAFVFVKLYKRKMY